MTERLDPDRWSRLNELYPAAAALPTGERVSFLDSACGDDQRLRREIESLLEFEAADVALGRGVEQALSDAAATLPAEVPLERIGPYRLLSEIGQGGMGAVYLGERDSGDFRQRVAVKVVRGLLGAEGLRRFRSERRILATLEHPSIARLIDGGTTDQGLPYLVMEFVDGARIDAYCRERALILRDRVDLFCRVCDAVSHAHRSLIVHRDIKPSNILVTPDGTPKLLDFGIAKLLDDGDTDAMLQTTPSMRVLTPEYASPEQIRGEAITTATDVYSLGVLLFELLTGDRPHHFQSRRTEDMERVVTGADAPRPSSTADTPFARELRGDLDTIVLTALQKEPARRYPSVDALAQDLRRYLGGLPIVARPATWRYRSQRFVRRHRFGVATAAAAALLIVGFTIALAVYARRAALERDTAQQVTRFMSDLFRAVNPAEARGNDVTVRQILDRGAERINREFGDRPDLRARLLDEIGQGYLSLRVADRAQAVLTEAVTVRRAMGDADSVEMAQTMFRLAGAYNMFMGSGQSAEAEPFARAALEIRRRRLGPRDRRVAASLQQVGSIMTGLGKRWVEIEPLHLQALEILRSTAASDAAPIASLQMVIARGRMESGDFAGAEPAAREAYRITSAAGTSMTVERLEADLLLANVLQQRDQFAEAETLVRAAVPEARKLFGDDHPRVQDAVFRLGLLLRFEGKLADAEAALRESIAIWRKRPMNGGGAWQALTALGAVLDDRGRFAEADPLFREGVDIAQRFPPGNPQRAAAKLRLVNHLLLQRRAGEALPILDDVLAFQRLHLGNDNPQILQTLVMRAEARAALGRAAEAEADFRDLLGRQRKAGQTSDPPMRASGDLGELLLDTNRAEEAAPFLRTAHMAAEKQLPEGNIERGHWALVYGAALVALGQRAEGEPLMRNGNAAIAAALPPTDPRVRDADRRMKALGPPSR